ncbi:reverse transcriptase domain-containing protein [Tanacetum coccineum]|uniref:Reverse transcriptase domain-containing protein n=1 Tax=Tanacetum coccineum TaxID=301880 RepID=A0ABQ4YMI8_9ASTR
MEQGFLSQKGSRVGRGVKEKQVSMADKLVEGRKHVNVVNAGLESFSTVYEEHGIQSSACNEENINDVGNKVRTTPVGNTPGKSSYANDIGDSSKKAVNICTLFTPGGTGLMLLCRWSRSELLAKGFSTDGLNSMLENGQWFICNHPLILRKWNPDVDLLKEDVRNVLVWVKLHGVPIMAFSEDCLSAIATKLSTLLMLDSDTSDMCLQSWGRSSYARVMIELWADIELKYNIMVVMPKIMVEGCRSGNGDGGDGGGDEMRMMAVVVASDLVAAVAAIVVGGVVVRGDGVIWQRGDDGVSWVSAVGGRKLAAKMRGAGILKRMREVTNGVSTASTYLVLPELVNTARRKINTADGQSC